jgi:lipoyl(octanoyl) transferase
MRWSFLGRAPYRLTVDFMEELRDRVIAGEDAERLLFCEHDPVVTLGRAADPAHVLAPERLAAQGVEVVRSTRGGDVTAHGPGQLVIYPVVRLTRGVVAFVEAVAGAIVDELAERGVAAAFRRQPAGVWVGDAKIAAVGLHIKRRVSAHGFALNVSAASTELFDSIVPCGLADARVTSLEREGGGDPPLAELSAALAERISRALDAKIRH